jgi:hypothetical protein
VDETHKGSGSCDDKDAAEEKFTLFVETLSEENNLLWQKTLNKGEGGYLLVLG